MKREEPLGLILVIIILVIACFAVTMMGCTSTTCVPTIEIQELDVPAPCVVHMEEVPEPVYEDYPPFAEPDEKQWSLEVERITQTNRVKREAYINALRHQIAEHNRLEPQCKQ